MLPNVQQALPDQIAGVRNNYANAGHRRTATLAADLAIGWRYFLDFAIDSGAITEQIADQLWADGEQAIAEAAQQQRSEQLSNEPTRRFFQLLVGALASGNAHVASTNGKPPENPSAWGWRLTKTTDGNPTDAHWKPLGDRIGWLEGEDLFLEPTASFKVAQEFGTHAAHGLTVTLDTLKKRLKDRKLLIITDPGRGTLTVRKTLDGSRREVLHLRADCILTAEDISPQD